ncbi:hypothetical protein ACSLBF_05420 [Pseudoalteromonas sp. T1lg65]|uniref:hypothetical protein n=1 Tax=Pseudoalteromonas sp. T1lg65 TaxID=2077101 RepID=UPI003F79F993
MNIRIFFICTLIVLQVACSSTPEQPPLSQKQVEDLKRLSELKQDLSQLLTLLEQQVDVSDIQQLPEQTSTVRVYKAPEKKPEAVATGVQVKLFPVSTSAGSQQQLQRHEQLLVAVKRRFPSIFANSYIQVEEVSNLKWATLNGLNSMQEAALYCRLFSIQSIDCKKIIL